ncbi:MAG: Periplasmic pH-dependent serine endoprotease DegQ precursor [Pseudomonadota bacterium]
MKREAVFSKSTRTVASVTNKATDSTTSSSELGKPDKSAAPSTNKPHFLKSVLRWDFAAVFLLGVVLSMLAMGVFLKLNPLPKSLTQSDIDGAVMHTLQNKELPSQSAKAAASVQGAVVHVQSYITDPKNKDVDKENGVGTGVVIKDDGTILTNFHVIAGAKKLKVTFFDGTEAEAIVIPDDLEPAILGSSQQLLPGDQVVAVGFPFGIGPSVSAGVVSGLNRKFKSPDGNQALSGLIQFDAAANPGNSGGPLVNMSGEVIGIVTAILNPTSARTFIGIGFATTIESAGSAVGLPPF